MTHEEAIRPVLEEQMDGISARNLFERVMLLMNEYGDPDDIARKCGLDPDDLIKPGKNFRENPKIGN